MPLNIPNFSLKDVKNFPYQVIIICLILSNVYFINRGDGNTDNYERRLERVNYQKDSISGKYFDVVVKLKGYQELVALKDSALYMRDSLLRKKTEKPAKEILNKK